MQREGERGNTREGSIAQAKLGHNRNRRMQNNQRENVRSYLKRCEDVTIRGTHLKLRKQTLFDSLWKKAGSISPGTFPLSVLRAQQGTISESDYRRETLKSRFCLHFHQNWRVFSWRRSPSARLCFGQFSL